MYKVFINDSAIIFTNNQEIKNKAVNFLKLTFFEEFMIDIIYQLIKKDVKLDELYLVVDDVDKAFLTFTNHFKVIKAAGGLVKNEEDKSLFIYRLDKWDLPKGKIEEGEDEKTAAIREVEEECGITGLTIINQLPDTFHIYEMNDEVILKQTYWFTMKSDFEGELTPQLEEDITEVNWFSNQEIKEKVLVNTYASISFLIN